MEQSPSWEANNHSASQILCLVRNSEVRCCLHKIPSLVSVLSQMNPVHTLPTCFSKIQPNIITLSTPMSSKCPVPFRLSNQNFVWSFQNSHVHYMPTSSYPWFYDCNIWQWEQNMKFFIHLPPASCYFPHRSNYFPGHPVLICYEPCSSPKVRDQVWHQHKTTHKIKVLSILIFTLLNRKCLTSVLYNFKYYFWILFNQNVHVLLIIFFYFTKLSCHLGLLLSNFNEY